MTWLRTLSIRTKLLGLILLILLPAFVVAGYFELQREQQLIVGERIEKAKSDMLLGYELIDQKWPGAWNVQNGKLFKGDTLINDNYEIVDLIGKVTDGDTVTIFLGDTRVTTNVKKEDGSRAVGTQASAPVVEAVLKQGTVYNAEANVVGTIYQAAYMPIKDAQGTIIGMWYVGAPSADGRIQELIADTRLNMMLTLGVVILIAMLMSWLFTRPIINRVQQVARVLEQVAGGDLREANVEVKSRDELGQMTESLNAMVRNLRGAMQQMRDASIQVASAAEELQASAEQTGEASEQIATTMQEIATGTDEQVRSIQTGRNVLEEVNRTVERITESAEHAVAKAVQASDRADSGTQAVQTAVEQMTAIDATIQQLSSVIHELGSRSQHIGKIVEAITGIAAQTSLLALNAAIESARAGEHGRGFAVVADEVRKLSNQSTASAQEIARYLEAIQGDIIRAIDSMEIGTGEVAVGLNVVRQAGHVFHEIQGDIREVSGGIAQVSVATNGLLDSTALTDSIRAISALAERNAAGSAQVSAGTEEQLATMEEVQSAAAELAEMSELMQETVRKFKIE